jgi:hypothetical protein
LRKTVLCIGVLAVMSATSLPASAILGAFNFTRSVTAAENAIVWKNDGGTSDKATMGSTGLTGNFVGLGGTTLTIKDLDGTTEPVGVTFAAQPFLSFDGAPALGVLDINFIALGAFSATDCHNPTRAPGQTCTPSSAEVPGGSPLMFTNTASNGTNVDGSSVSFSARGVTEDGLAQWSGVWTAQFNEPYQDVLTTFSGPAGAVANTYSASIVVTANPEPDTTILLGAGLMAISLGVRKLRRT